MRDLKTSLAAQTEGEPALAERGIVVVLAGEVITVPGNDFGVHGGVDVVVHAQEVEVVFVNFAVRIVTKSIWSSVMSWSSAA